jgi:putative cell wall-binding protein
VRRALAVSAAVALLAGVQAAAALTAGSARAATSAPTWTSLQPAKSPPPGADSSTVYDAATGQLVAYDDDGGCTPYATWTWDGAAWSLHQQVHPPQLRDEPTLGYDPASRQVVMYGGFASDECPGDTFEGMEGETWTWNGSIWTQQHPATSPSPRWETCAAYDEQTGQFITFGGWGYVSDEPFYYNETWNWTGTTWVQLLPALTPPGGGCSMTYDAARKVIMLLVAGAGTGGSTQAWAWNGTTWNRLTDPPAAVNPMALNFDPDTGNDITYVGQGTCTTLGPMATQCDEPDQTWIWDGSAWSQAPVSNNPQPGAAFAASYDEATHQYAIIGGVVNFGAAENDATLVYSTPGSSSAMPTRVSGANREATAVAASTSAFSTAGSAAAAVLARADDFADALAGGPLAAAKHGPLLLTSSGSLDAVTAAEIQRVLPKGGTVYLLGGTSAISDAVATAITALGDVATRIAGTDRFGTAVAIAGAMGNPSTVFEASGTNFPDALSAVPAAVANHGAILLTNGAAQAAVTAAYLTAHATTRYAIGGPAAYADPSAIGIAGADRYATSDAVALAFFPDTTGVSVASAANFPDALAAGPVAGTANQPVLLVPPSGALPEPVTSYLTTHANTIAAVQAFGGTNAIANTVLTELAATLKG